MRPWYVFSLLAALSCARLGAQEAPTQSELEHVPPDPPQAHVHEMSYGEMAEMMGMDDRSRHGKISFDQLEWRDDSDTFAWDAQAWYGGDVHKLVLQTEGERHEGTTRHARIELLGERIVSRWWSLRAGLRHDPGLGPTRNWISVGLAGLAPGFIEVEAVAYLGEQGRSAARFEAEYDLLLTQRLMLQPQAELLAYGRDDPARGLGSGLATLELGLRLRYEIRREFAPYVGIHWQRAFGNTADMRRAARADTAEVNWLAGLRVWF